jgi:cathepsin C
MVQHISAAYVVGGVIAVALQLASADLPVHCLRHQVAGEWEFTLGPLGPKRTSCGHTKPDNPYKQPHMKFLESMGPLSKRKFTLNDPNTVSTDDGNSGTWTMIYDEGFEVATAESVFFAFSKFTWTDADRQNNVSHCGETQIGWYRDKSRNHWGCYVGKKVGVDSADAVEPVKAPVKAPEKVSQAPATALASFGSASDEAASPQEDEERTVEKTISAVALSQEDKSSQKTRGTEILTSWLDQADQMALAPDAPAEAAPADSAAPANSYVQTEAPAAEDEFASPPEYKPWVPSSAGFDKPMAGQWQESVATAINFLQLGWKASAYDKFQGKTPRELNRYAGVKRTRLHAEGKAKPTSRESFTSFLGTSSRVRHSSYEGETFDWRSKDGHSWLTPVVTQGDCGSCYTISTVHMLTARNKIRSGSTKEPSFSVSFPLYCSEYNQGCDGGYGFLQSKWTEDVGLVPESCAPFSEGGGSCQIASGCNLGNKRYRATGHHYVGGYYGGADADNIRKELVEHGPVVMSFEPKEDFMYYKEGVYKSGPEKLHQEWEQVDHAVLLMGYGMDKTTPYWTMQNSWGTDWGEDGYFRMQRGNDESGCESIVVSADVIQEDSNPVLDSFIASL